VRRPLSTQVPRASNPATGMHTRSGTQELPSPGDVSAGARRFILDSDWRCSAPRARFNLWVARPPPSGPPMKPSVSCKKTKRNWRWSGWPSAALLQSMQCVVDAGGRALRALNCISLNEVRSVESGPCVFRIRRSLTRQPTSRSQAACSVPCLFHIFPYIAARIDPSAVWPFLEEKLRSRLV
jgi:hypothetical protein